jgi:uncharacterized cupin superfamily protein
MKYNLHKWRVDKHSGWRAYWWKGHEEKDLSFCIIEIDPGKSLDHRHINPNEHETEVILEGESFYEGEVNKKLKEGDVIDQYGISELIKLKNVGDKPLKLLCINRPPWKEEDEEIYTK